MGPIVLTQLGLSMVAGAVLVKSVMDQNPMAGQFPKCPTCNGSGRVACMCSRWSDLRWVGADGVQQLRRNRHRPAASGSALREAAEPSVVNWFGGC